MTAPFVCAFLAALWVTVLAASPSWARDPLVRVEPPMPSPPAGALEILASRSRHVLENRTWAEMRTEQLTFVEVLRAWGIRVDVDTSGTIDDLAVPGQVTIRGGWNSADNFFVDAEFALPRNASGIRLSGTFTISEGGDGPVTGGAIQVAVGGAGVSAGGSWSPMTGFALNRNVSVENALTRLQIDVPQDAAPSLGVGFKFGNCTVTVDPVQYVRRARQVAPALASDARRRIANTESIEIAFDAALVAAAVSNRPSLWASALRHRIARITWAERWRDMGFFEMLMNERLAYRIGAGELKRIVAVAQQIHEYQELEGSEFGEWYVTTRQYPKHVPSQAAFPELIPRPAPITPMDPPPLPKSTTAGGGLFGRGSGNTGGGRLRLPKSYGPGGFQW